MSIQANFKFDDRPNKATLTDIVSYHISSPQKTPVCPPEALACTYPPHIAEAYPSPPSGTKPTWKSNLLRQRRHGRVKPFLGKQQYLAKEVTVIENDMQYPAKPHEEYREGKRARGAAMDKRQKISKGSSTTCSSS